MMGNKRAMSSVLVLILLTGCGEKGPASQSAAPGTEETASTMQTEDATAPPVASGTVSTDDSGSDVPGGATKTDEDCSVQASWTGDFEGTVDWVPELAPGYSGFTVEYKKFTIELGRFNLTAEFEAPFVAGDTGTFNGKASYFYVTDAPYAGRMGVEGKASIGFPMHHDRVARGVPVTLEITQWRETQISGSVSAGPFTGVASGPEAPRVGGPSGPLEDLTVSGSAQFQASGDISNALMGRTMCHKPYLR
jgi:predicted small lipoprotein YifL